MEGKDLTDNIIRNIVSEIIRECKNRCIKTSSQFISYYVSLLQLDPNRGLTYEHLTERENVQTFVRYVVEQLGSRNDPKILTLRLQHEFRTYIKDLDETVHIFRRDTNSRLYPLLLDIIEQDKKYTDEQLYRKICYYTTLASGLGNPAEKIVFREALQVLKSVIEEEEIAIFPSLQNYIKQELIASLVDIMTGIRLYNKSCNKGGEGMADLPLLLERAINAVRNELIECIEQALHRAALLTQSFEKNMTITELSTGEWGILLKFSSPQAKVNWEFKRDLATAHRQLSKTTRILLESINELEKHRKILQDEFNRTIEELNRIVVPTLYQTVTDVFPHFTQLANIWKQLQDDSLRLREICNIFKIQTEQIFSLPFDENLRPEPYFLDIWLHYEEDHVQLENHNPDIVIHMNTDDFTKKDLEFRGYCCWVLTNTEGALIPAKIHLGVFEYQRKFYGFSSRIAANNFCQDPESFIMKTYDLARKCVHLIKFLDLEPMLREKMNVKILIQPKEKIKNTVRSQGVQTETHFEQSHINYNYCWNIWNFKRALLKYNSLTKKKTKSCEAEKIYKQESMHTQTYDMISLATQTNTDNYANTKKRSRYVHGLRGIAYNNPIVFDLTESVDCSQKPMESNKK